MRLRGCVAVELLVGALVVGSVSGAAMWGVGEWRDAFAGKPAGRADRAAHLTPAGQPAVAQPVPIDDEGEANPPALVGADSTRAAGAKLASASLSAAFSGEPVGERDESPPAEPEPPWRGQFLGQSDAALVTPLRDSPVSAVKLNRGGSSLSLRIDFESGGRGACKPNQIHLQSQPRREIAAYRINRLLGLSSVPPAFARRFRVEEIAARFKPEAGADRVRFLAEIVRDREDAATVLGEVTWWIPVLSPAKIDGFDIDSTDGVVTWKRYLAIGKPIPPASLPMAAQVSDLVLFDFLINNSDRWSGGNIKTSTDPNLLVFIDNTLSFGSDPNGHNRVRTYLYRSQKFSRRLVERLRRLAPAELEEALTRDIDPFPFLLEKGEIEAALKRRDFALHYIDELIASHGEDAVFAFQ